jgi:hypothetical protein
MTPDPNLVLREHNIGPYMLTNFQTDLIILALSKSITNFIRNEKKSKYFKILSGKFILHFRNENVLIHG